MPTIASALLSVVISVAAQFLFKLGMRSLSDVHGGTSGLTFELARRVALNGYILTGFLLYGLGAVIWLSVLEKWDVSKAYPIVGFGFALTAIFGAILGEAMTIYRATGTLLICSGVWLVSRS